MSQVFENLLLGAFLIGSMIFVVFIVTRVHRAPHLLVASIAGRWKGKVHSGGVLTGTWIEFQVDEVVGEVTFGESKIEDSGLFGTSGVGWTRVRLNWAGERRLRVIPEGLGTRLRRLVGGSEIQFDDPFFDDRFWIESSHPTWARGVLDAAARQGIGALSRQGAVTLDMGPAGIVLRVARVLVDDPGSLGSFIELAVAVLLKAKGLADTLGVKLEPLHSRIGSPCPVCGQAVADERLPCPTCRTPHHLDCWKYFGGCAIFGCRTRMRRERA